MDVFICIGYLCGILLLPLIPAYIIYKYLPPSKTIVRGPFKGLKINLAGAFAGYFLLVLIALSFTYYIIIPSKPSREIWFVKGEVVGRCIDPNTNTLKEMKVDAIEDTTIGVFPPPGQVDSTGFFTTEIIVEPGHVEGQRKFPLLEYHLPGYTTPRERLNIEDPNIIVDEKNRLIVMKKKVILEKLKDETERPKWE